MYKPEYSEISLNLSKISGIINLYQDKSFYLTMASNCIGMLFF